MSLSAPLQRVAVPETCLADGHGLIPAMAFDASWAGQRLRFRQAAGTGGAPGRYEARSCDGVLPGPLLPGDAGLPSDCAPGDELTAGARAAAVIPGRAGGQPRILTRIAVAGAAAAAGSDAALRPSPALAG